MSHSSPLLCTPFSPTCTLARHMCSVSAQPAFLHLSTHALQAFGAVREAGVGAEAKVEAEGVGAVDRVATPLVAALRVVDPPQNSQLIVLLIFLRMLVHEQASSDLGSLPLTRL